MPVVGVSLARLFAIDLRSLALFRIGVALVLLFDTIDRVRDLGAFYTDAGVLPTSLLAEHVRGPLWSLHARLPAAAEPALFALAILAALALLVGWKTRLVAVLSWCLLASIHQRNPLLAFSGGDPVLRTLLFWGMFLPLGARFSLDARRSRDPLCDRVFSFGAAALLLQVALIYVWNGLEKLQGAWLQGTALAYALDMSFFRGPLSATLRSHESVLALGTFLTPAFELLAPWLAFVPVRTEALRLAAIVLFVGFHLFLAALFSISIFSAICIVAWIPFLPTGFWQAVEARLGAGTGTGALLRPRGPLARALDALAPILFLYVVLQLGTQWAGLALPRALFLSGHVLQLNQRWAQFAHVAPVDAWPVVRATTAGGTEIDPILGGPPLVGRPVSLPARFPNYKWRIYYVGLVQRALAKERAPGLRRLFAKLADYHCRDWNAEHPGGDALIGIRIAVVIEGTDPNRIEAPKERFVHEQRCARGP
jgi:Vitamin K-dependent gamma-carboxylase